MTLDFNATREALAERAVAFIERHDLVIASGPDARTYLQGQLTQDLDRLAPGSSTESFVLSPQGKLDGYVRVWCKDDDTFYLDTASGYGEDLFERLRRFKLRVKVELTHDEREVVAVRGARAVGLRDRVGPETAIFDCGSEVLKGFDAYVERSTVEAMLTAFGGDGIEELELGDPEALELARILAGEPVLGAELTERTIPQETTMTSRCVSFTKGCFTGQELVARLDARGANVARHLRGLVVEPGARHERAFVGEPVEVAGAGVGTITSVTFSTATGRSYALGFVHRRIEPPTSGEIVAAGGEDRLVARILELPFSEV